MTADELRALTAAATPGPWLTEGKNALAADEQGLAILAAMCPLEADAALIVWLRNHADVLADLIDAASRVYAWCVEKDDGQPWNLIMQMGETLAALDQEAPT